MNAQVGEVSKIVRNVLTMMSAITVIGGFANTSLLLFIVGANLKNCFADLAFGLWDGMRPKSQRKQSILNDVCRVRIAGRTRKRNEF